MRPMNSGLVTAYDNLSTGLDRQRDGVSETIDAVVSAHQHGGKEAFDERIASLRGAVSNMISTVDAMRQMAGHIGSLPVAPVAAAVADSVSAEVASAEAIRGREARTTAPAAKG